MTLPDQERPSADLRAAAARQGSFSQTFKAVAWSFFGVRKSSDHEDDIAKLNPVHVIVIGVLSAAALVLGLLGLVRWVVRSGIVA
jgi:hypothetical protein